MSYAYLKVNRRSQKVCEVEGTTFLINWTLEADDSTVATTRNRPTPAAIFWACLVGPKTESADFKYSLQILSSRYVHKHYKLCSGLVLRMMKKGRIIGQLGLVVPSYGRLSVLTLLEF